MKVRCAIVSAVEICIIVLAEGYHEIEEFQQEAPHSYVSELKNGYFLQRECRVLPFTFWCF
jgi:hypothetical protein